MPKRALALSKVYRLIEPGPVVLLTTTDGRKPNVMPMSWHTMLEFEPPLIGCVVSNRNHSYGLLTSSRECVINIPGVDIADAVVACGNCSGKKLDKFARFGLTASPAKHVAPPLIDECHASLECRIADDSMRDAYGFFVLEVLKAWIDPAVKTPRTLHHIGYGDFMVAGERLKLKSKMR